MTFFPSAALMLAMMLPLPRWPAAMSVAIHPAHASMRAASGEADTATSTYTVNGIRIIHRHTNTSLVVANLYLLGGVRQTTARNAGIESFLLAVSERGTQRYPRDVLRRAMARTGSEITVQPQDDWTLVGVRTTTSELDSTWSIFADRLMNPTIDPVDVQFIREQLVLALRQRADSPDATLDYLADSIAYAGHPYSLSAVGTEASVAGITPAQLRAYQHDQFVTSRMLLVVVGNVTREKVESLVRTTIGRMPAGSYTWTMPDTIPTRPGDAVIAPRTLPTNYIQGYFEGPPANSPDAPALRVAAAVMSGRMFAEIRSRRNLTYAVSASFRDRGLSSIGLYVTTTAPDTTIALMRSEVRAMQEGELETELLRPLVQQFITEYFLDNETITAQADFLARAQLYRGDFRAGDRFVAELRGVTGADVQRVSRRYFTNIRWAYVGDPTRVRRDKLLSF
jgi:zinc protease